MLVDYKYDLHFDPKIKGIQYQMLVDYKYDLQRDNDIDQKN